jgi:hypothetical protein
MENLIFRRQFLISSKRLEFDKNWKTTSINKYSGKFFIYSHPDLEVTTTTSDSADIFMLGYIIDPYHPDRSNKEILDDLLKSDSFGKLVSNTESFGGRFVIVYNSKDGLHLFHDATGFREVFYYKSATEFACGSTPNILSTYLHIKKDEEAEINQFFNSSDFNTSEKIWIGTRTIFKDVYRLLPNHSINLIDKKVNRFWPDLIKSGKSLDEVAALLGEIISGTYSTAVKRYQLDHSLTSGWDTRLLLACSKNQVHNIKYYFYKGFKNEKGKDSIDYLVTKQIADELNLKARFVQIGDIKVSSDFEKIFYSNNIMSRPKLLNAFYDSYVNKLENTMTVSGTMGNEIFRLMSSINRRVKDPHTIAKMVGYEKFPYIVNSINDWLNEANPLKDKGHILIDLFFWEQYIGNWGSLSAAEQDIVREELRPLNNRALISAFLSLEDKNRYRDYPQGYIKTIQLLWPELLKFDMDMPSKKLKKALRAIGIEQLTDKVYQSIKN